jgi:hypothetical protein
VPKLFIIGILTGVVLSLGAFNAKPNVVKAATNNTINFQARVLTSSGSVIPDGNVNIQFKLYDNPSGGNNPWTETQTVPAKNGYVTVNLGAVTTFPGTIDWSQELWLTLNVNGDGEMGPTRMKVTGVPFSFRSGQADSLTNGNGTISASSLAQLGSLTVQSTTSSNAALRVNQLGSGGLLQLQAGGSDVFSVSNAGEVVAGGGLRVGNSTSNVAGTIRWNGTAFEGYNGFEWAGLGSGSSGTAQTTFTSGLANVAANQTGLPVEMLVFTSATGVSNTAGITGFTAPAAGSFRSCLVKNNAAITAGTLSLRWVVNGVSVGSPACGMNSTTNRQSATTINPGTVTFNAGDTIGIAFDTNAAFLPTASNDFTVYWTVEYTGTASGVGGSGYTLQAAYDNSLVAAINTTNNKDIVFGLSNTAIDSNFLVNIENGSSSKFAVQNSGSDIFSVSGLGDAMTGRGLTLGTSSSTTAGTLRWTGTDFEGFDGSNWISLTTGGGGGGMTTNIVSKVKQVSETVNGSNALQDDDELTFAIGPGEEWSYRFVVHGNSGTTPDFQFAVSAPAGATCVVGYSDPEGAASVGNLGCGTTTGTIAGNGVTDVYEIVGTVKNSSTAGNVTLRWAQFTSNASNTIVYAGSYLQAIRSIGAGANGQPFAQGGNSFGATAVLGTSDDNDLSIISNGLARLTIDNGGNVGIGDTTPAALFTVGTNDALQIDSSGNLQTTGTIGVGGLVTLDNGLVANGSSTAVTATTEATPRNDVTTVTLTGAAFANNDVIRINNSGQDYYTRIVSGGGTASLVVSPAVSYDAGATVERYGVQSIGATSTDYSSESNRFFQGYFLGGVVIGTGSTIISDGNINSSTTLTLQGDGGSLVVGGALSVSGTITGDGSGISNIDGANITAGSIDDSSLSANVSLLGNTTNAANGLVKLDTNGYLPELNGSALTNLNATNISSGTLDNARLSSSVTLVGNTFNGANNLVQLDGSGNLPALDGSALTSLNGSNIASGTVGDSYLSTNVALLNRSTQTFSGKNTFQDTLTVSSGGASITGGLGLNSGNISGLGASITASGALEIISTGGTNDLKLTSGSGLIELGANKLSRTAVGTTTIDLVDASNTTLALTNSGAGNANFSVDGSVGIGTTPSTNKLSINTPSTSDTNAQAIIYTDGINNKGLVIQAVNSQNANTFEVQNNSGQALAGFNNTGQLVLGNDNPSAQAGMITFNDSTGSNSFTSVLGTTNLSSTRSINLPDENGTICVQGSVNCGFIILGPASVQTDSSTNPTVFVNKTGSSGNIITLQKNGISVFSVLNSGALQLQLTDTSAFQVNNNSGTQYFDIDTSAGIVQIGGATADSVGVILVLDTKNTSGDPSGQEGAMYYNSSYGKFRCYQNSRGWTDCLGIPKPNTRRTTQAVANGTANTFSVMGDNFTNAGTGTATATAATTSQPATINYATANALNNIAGISGNTNYNSSGKIGYQTYISLPATATMRVWAGVTNQTAATMAGSANPAGTYAAFRYDTGAGDTTWRCITRDGTTQNNQNSGINISTSGFKLEIVISSGSVEFMVNGVTVCTNTTNLPTANTLLRASNTITNLVNGVDNLRIGWVYVEYEP